MAKKSKTKRDQYYLSDIFQAIELKLIASMRRNLKKHEDWEDELGFQWEQWQRAKLRNIEMFRRDNRMILNEYKQEVQDTIDEVLKQSYGKAYNDSIKLAEEIHADLDALDISFPDTATDLGELEIPEENFFQINDDKLDAIINEMQGVFRNHNGVIMRKMDDVYRQTLDKYVLEMGLGATTHQKAVDEVTKDFLAKGIDSITYKDGKKVNIASYAEMYLRTANQRANFIAQGRVRDRIRVFTVLVSQHANCCDSCMTWQNRVLIDDVFTTLAEDRARAKEQETSLGHPLLSTAIKDGLFHPNCRHNITTFFPGKSTIPERFSNDQEEKALKRYKLEQEQRALERQVRHWKRVKEGSVDEENRKIATGKVRTYQGYLRNHIKSNPNLRRNYWRERSEQIMALIEPGSIKQPIPSKPYEDVTQEWLDAIDHSKVGKVIENDYFEVNGVRYDSSNATIKQDFGDDEIKIANWLRETFHEDVQLVPRVTIPKGIRTSDFIMKNEYWDLKSIEGTSKETIINRIKQGKGQSNDFVIDITPKSKLTDEMINKQIDYIYRSKHMQYVNKIIIIKDKKLQVVLQKKR